MNVLLFKPPGSRSRSDAFRTSRRWRTGRIIFKTLAISFVLYGQTYGGFITAKQYGDHAPKHPLYGLYQVETFALNGDTLAPMLTDTTRWRQVMVGGYKSYPTLTVRYKK